MSSRTRLLRPLAVLATGAAIASGVMVPAATAEQSADCAWTRTILPVPAGHQRGEARSGDGRGNVVGATDIAPSNPLPGAPRYAALWENGVLAHAATTTGYSFNDINKTGTIVGWTTVSGRRDAARFDRSGRAVALPRDPQWTSSNAVAVNDRGDIAGWAAAQSPTRYFPVLWPAGSPGAFRLLPTPKPLTEGTPEVTDIDEVGRVIASLHYWQEIEHPAVIWDENQTMRILQRTPSGRDASPPRAIRAGRIVADITDGTAGEWTANGTHVGLLDSAQAASVRTIGGRGTVGGQRSPQQYHPYQPVLWQDGKLTAILPSDPAYTAAVTHLSDDELTAYGTETVSHIMPPVFYSKNAIHWRC